MRSKSPKYPNGYVDVPIGEDTYVNMLKLGWCLKSANGIIHLTPLGKRELIQACLALKQEPEIRPEWLAPD